MNLSESEKNFVLKGSDTAVALDDSGKAVMDHIYNKTDPRAYCRSLRMLQYLIPDAVQPVLRHLVTARRRAEKRQKLKLIDLGCSYGVTGRLLRSGQTMEETFRHYAALSNRSRDELIEHDRAIFDANRDKDLSIVGLDVASNACAFAVDSGAIDNSVVANLEENDPTAADSDAMRGADLLVSTGCIGYVGAPTMIRIFDACGDSRPWMAHFVLRMFDFSPIREVLTERGYVTRRGSTPVYQRKFASPDEQDEIVSRLIEMGRDPTGLEDDGSAYADLYISRPAEDRSAIMSAEWNELLQTA